MTQDEIIRMAREAGLYDSLGCEQCGFDEQGLERFANLVAEATIKEEMKKFVWPQSHWTAYEEAIFEATKEKAAKVCEGLGFEPEAEARCAAAIRSMKQ